MDAQAWRSDSDSGAATDRPQDIDAVITTLAPPAVSFCSRAASRLQPLTPADMSALQDAAHLQLAEIITTLRSRYNGLTERATAERAVTALIDLPQAMRTSVQSTRGAAVKGAAA